MAEKLITEDSLSNYLKKIDMTNDKNKRVLASIELLHPSILETLMYYLVQNIIDISYLYSYQINNNSAKMIIQTLENQSETIISKKKYYSDLLGNMVTYKNFILVRKSVSNQSLARLLTASGKFMTTYTVDPLGITAGTFTSTNEALRLYDKCIILPEVKDSLNILMNSAKKLANTYNIPRYTSFINYIVSQVNAYKFIRANTATNTNSSNIGSGSIVGFFIRQQYYDLPYVNLIENMNNILNLMAENFEVDTTKQGFYTVNDSMTKTYMSYNNLFNTSGLSPVNEDTFLLNLSRVVNLRYVLYTNIFKSFADPNTLDLEVKTYNALQENFVLLSNYLSVVVKVVASKFEEFKNATN